MRIGRVVVRLLAFGAFLAGISACLNDWNVDDQTFPCRTEDDCVEGFECDPVRFVCVEQGTASVAADASIGDTGTSSVSGDAGI